MKKHFTATGIVLRRMAFKEADHLVTILTREQGKIALIAKGGRKPSSRLCGRMEIASQIGFSASEGRGLHQFKEVEHLRFGDFLEAELGVKASVFALVEVAYRLLPEAQPSESIHDLLAEALEALKYWPEKNEIILHAFLVKLLTEMGFMASWDWCSETNQKLDLEQTIYLSPSGESLSHLSQVGDRTLSPALVKWINFLQKQPFNQILHISPSLIQSQQTSTILQNQLRHLLSTPLRSEKALAALRHHTGKEVEEKESFPWSLKIENNPQSS